MPEEAPQDGHAVSFAGPASDIPLATLAYAPVDPPGPPALLMFAGIGSLIFASAAGGLSVYTIFTTLARFRYGVFGSLPSSHVFRFHFYTYKMGAVLLAAYLLAIGIASIRGSRKVRWHFLAYASLSVGMSLIGRGGTLRVLEAYLTHPMSMVGSNAAAAAGFFLSFLFPVALLILMNLRSVRSYCASIAENGKPVAKSSQALGVAALFLLWLQLNGARWAWYLLDAPQTGAWVAISCHALLTIYLAIVACLLLQNRPAARRQAMWCAGLSITFYLCMALLILGNHGESPEVFGASSAEELQNLGNLALWDCAPPLLLLIGVNLPEIWQWLQSQFAPTQRPIDEQA